MIPTTCSARKILAFLKAGASVGALLLASTAGSNAQAQAGPQPGQAEGPVQIAQNAGLGGVTDPITGRVGAVDLRGALDIPDAREFYILPKLGIQESFTDNALLTSINPQNDFVTRFNLAADLGVNTGRTLLSIQSALSYDQYARNNSLSDWSLFGTANGTYAIIPGFLYLDGEGEVTNGSISSFGSTAIDRSGTVGRVQLATYDIGPRLTTTVLDYADLVVRGRVAQVNYEADDAGTTAFLPSNATIFQATGVADTGQRYAGYELVSAGNFQRDDRGFQLYNGIQSLFVRVLPDLRLIGRGGYEHIQLPTVGNVNAPIWSAGLEYTLNQYSRITLEGGNRYNHTNWSAEAFIRLDDRLYWSAEYYELLAPAQIEINNSFSDFMNLSRLIPTPLLPTSSPLFGNLVNQPSLSKNADTHLVYEFEGNNLDLAVTWNDRRFVATGDHDRSLEGRLTYTHRFAADITGQLLGSYARTFSSPIFGQSQSYGGEINIGYDLNSTLEFRTGYAIARNEQITPIQASILENVVFVSLEKRL